MTLTSPPCPTIEVALGENGKIVVLRQTGTDGDAREQHSTRHPIHAPTTRVVVSSSTDAGSPWNLIAVSDHDHVKDAASDRMIQDMRWLTGLSRYRSA